MADIRGRIGGQYSPAPLLATVTFVLVISSCCLTSVSSAAVSKSDNNDQLIFDPNFLNIDPPGEPADLEKGSLDTHGPVVTTPSGLLRGVTIDPPLSVSVSKHTPVVGAFLGVPFAQAPVGGLRYRSPQPVDPWKGSRDATHTMPACRGRPGPTRQEAPYLQPGRNVVERTSEDCLYLNVYVPGMPPSTGGGGADKQTQDDFVLKAVAVYIHGGSFETGSSHDIDAPLMSVRGDVVVVTISYRLWYYGFAAGSNFGIEDQLMALRWVQENIGSFQGDAGRVTVMGFDAGATSAHIIARMPQSQGLIDKLVLINGCLYTPTSSGSVAPATGDDVLDTLRQCPDNETEGCLQRLGVDLTLSRDYRPIPTALNNTEGANTTLPVTMIGFLEIGDNWLNRTDRVTIETIRSSVLERVLATGGHLKTAPLVSAAILFQYTARDPDTDVELLAKMLEDFLLLTPLSETIEKEDAGGEGEIFAFVHGACESQGESPRCLFEPQHTGENHRHHSGDFINYLTNFIRSGNPSTPHKVPEPWQSLARGDDDQSAISSPTIYFPTSSPRKPITLPRGYRQHYVDFWSRFLPSIPTYQTLACHTDVSDDAVTFATTTLDLSEGEVLLRLPRDVGTECPVVDNCTDLYNNVVYDRKYVVPLSVFLCVAILTILIIILLLSYLLAKRAEYNYIRGPTTHSATDDSPVHRPNGDKGALVNSRPANNPDSDLTRPGTADEGGFDELGNLRMRAPLAQSEHPGESPML